MYLPTFSSPKFELRPEYMNDDGILDIFSKANGLFGLAFFCETKV